MNTNMKLLETLEDRKNIGRHWKPFSCGNSGEFSDDSDRYNPQRNAGIAAICRKSVNEK